MPRGAPPTDRRQQSGAPPSDRHDQSGAPPSDRRKQFCNRLNASKVEIAKDILETFLTEQFEGGRHSDRIAKIHALEEAPRAAKRA